MWRTIYAWLLIEPFHGPKIKLNEIPTCAGSEQIVYLKNHFLQFIEQIISKQLIFPNKHDDIWLMFNQRALTPSQIFPKWS